MIYKHSFSVSHYDCNNMNILKMSSLMKYLQQTSSTDTTSEITNAQLLYSKNMVFLLTKMSAKIHQMPVCSEQIVAATSYIGIKGAKFIREYILEAQNGNRLVSSVTEWVLVDVNSHKILRPSNSPYNIEPQQHIVDDQVYYIEYSKNLQNELISKNKIDIRYSNLDINQHVNNSIYADFICDCLPYEIISTATPKAISINFKKEAIYGQTIEISTFKISDTKYQLIAKHQNDSTCFESVVEF